eukprot:Hpha_TRINITY_DN14439_c2_g7::TRINITY_DN14439_c2_g7_i1::g.157674::m.157674
MSQPAKVLLLLFGSCAAATGRGPLPRENGRHAALTHHTLWQRLGVKHRVRSEVHSPALSRVAHPLDVQPAGSAEGLRVHLHSGALADRKKTCLPQNAEARGLSSTQLTGLGEVRCPANVLTILREHGDNVNVSTTGATVSAAADALMNLIEAGGTEEQMSSLASQYSDLALLCAQYDTALLNRQEAALSCEARGGTLLTISAATTETVLQRFVADRGTNATFWTGLRILDATKRPVTVAWDSKVPIFAWDQRWNTMVGSGTECCPGLETAFGDASCVVFDIQRHREGLRPFVVVDCSERHPFFCEVQTEFFDPFTNGPVQVTVNEPAYYYYPQDTPSVAFYDRVKGELFEAACLPERVVDPPKRSVVEQTVRAATRYLSMLLGPRIRQTGAGPISGNAAAGAIFQCMHEYFTFNLTEEMTKVQGQFELPGVDLLVMLTAVPDTDVAWAYPCSLSVDLRPVVVVLNVAPNQVDRVLNLPLGKIKFRNRILHALLQAVGFHTDLFGNWQQPVVNTTVQTPSCTVSNSNSCRNVTLVATPAVKKWVETVHFKCSGNPNGGSGVIGGAELEDGMLDTTGSAVVLPYWEKRIFKGEILTVPNDISEDRGTDVAVVSGLTLAAFEDMGWYIVNPLMQQTLQWGRLQRCEFANGDCTQWSDRYRLVPASPMGAQELQCSPDFLSLASSNVVTWPDREIPLKFRWLSGRPNEGGSDALMDFCPLKRPIARSCLIPSPGDEECQVTPCRKFQVRGPSSRCLMSTIRYKVYEGKVNTSVSSAAVQAASAPPVPRGTCMPVECELGVAGWFAHLWIGGQQYTCNTKGEQVGPSEVSTVGVSNSANFTLLGSITCPDPRELCTEAGAAAVQRSCDPIEDCFGNGYCDETTGSCVCFSSKVSPGPDPTNPHLGSRGFFGGERCDRCEAGYFGWPQCRSKRCPADPDTGVMCHAHGRCNGTSGVCICAADTVQGHWHSATACSTCASGWVGGTCQIPRCINDADCGQGTCTSATGICQCHVSQLAGFWEGTRCDRCREGYDSRKGCKVRVEEYFACDAQRDADCLLSSRAEIDCSSCSLKCTADGKQTAVCRTPHRIIPEDERGCAVDARIPRCASQVTSCGPCPVSNPVRIDCQGFPNPYTTCWVPDECGCLPPVFVQCETGTDAIPSPTVSLGVSNPEGVRDVRAAYPPTSTKQCRCPDRPPALSFDCWGPLAADDTPLRVKGRVVFFEPRSQQIFEEDFCHCSNPPVPGCTADTKPYYLPELAHDKHLDCRALLEGPGCPDWAEILNVGQAFNPSAPDLSVIDCAGWPAPRFRSVSDPCGCPLPKFSCMKGTRGECAAPPECPRWPDLIEVDCGGYQPPVLTLRAPHPCGCPPPPPITCRAGTGSCCNCDYPTHETVWVDCKGVSMDLPPYDPGRVWPRGNPMIQPCDPCPQCIPPQPVRRCIPGTSSPRPAAQAAVSYCPEAGPDLSQCPVYPPPCPIDCH